MVDIIFFAVLALFVAYKLSRVLGNKKYNHDHKFDRKEKKREDFEADILRFPEASQKLEEKEEQQEREKAGKTREEEEKKKQEIIYGSAPQECRKSIDQIRKFDSNFTITSFLKKAEKAYEVVFDSYTKGDKKTLVKLLDKSLYELFVKEIDTREKRGWKRVTTFVSFIKVQVKDVAVIGKQARIAVTFLTEQINFVKDVDDKVIEGDPSQVDEVEENWTFVKDLSLSSPNWLLAKVS